VAPKPVDAMSAVDRWTHPPLASDHSSRHDQGGEKWLGLSPELR